MVPSLMQGCLPATEEGSCLRGGPPEGYFYPCVYSLINLNYFFKATGIYLTVNLLNLPILSVANSQVTVTPNKKTCRSNSKVNSIQYCQQSEPTVGSRAESLATDAKPLKELTCVPTVQPRPSQQRPRAGPQCRLACSGAEVFRHKTSSTQTSLEAPVGYESP